MITSKTLYQGSGEFCFPIHEYAIIGDKHIIKDGHYLLPAKVYITHIYISAFEFAGVTGLTAININHTGSIQRNSKGNGPFLFILFQGIIRHNQNFVRVNHSRLVKLASPYYYSIFPSFYYMEIGIWVRLLSRTFRAVTTSICHATI